MNKKMIVVVLSVVALLLVACTPQQEGAEQGALAGEAVSIPGAPTKDFTGEIPYKCTNVYDDHDSVFTAGTMTVYYRQYSTGRITGTTSKGFLEECKDENTLIERACINFKNGKYTGFVSVEVPCNNYGLKCKSLPNRAIYSADGTGPFNPDTGAICT